MSDGRKEWLLNWVLEPTQCQIHQTDLTIDGDEIQLTKSCLNCKAEKLNPSIECLRAGHLLPPANNTTVMRTCLRCHQVILNKRS